MGAIIRDTERLRNVDYLVIYYQFQKNRNEPEILIRELEPLAPEKVINLHGIELVRIYKVSELPETIFYSAISSD